MSLENDPLFADGNEIKSGVMKFNKVGDAIKGTLLERKKQKSNYKDEVVNFYKFLVHAGVYHDLNDEKQLIETPVELVEGTIIGVWGKPQLDDKLSQVKYGQIVGIRLSEKKKSATPGYNPTSIFSVYPGGMDPNYMGQETVDTAEAGAKIPY